jgi:serine/threonine protein kinase
MRTLGESREFQLPFRLNGELAILDRYLGAGGMAHVFHAQLHNLPGLIAELMVAGETDPALFRLDIPFTFGQGPLTKDSAIHAIREKGAALWEEHRQELRSDPSGAARRREEYLRIIDARLLQNPNVAVKVLRQDETDPEVLDRHRMQFSVEDSALRRLNHKGIIRRYGRIDEPTLGPCLFMEQIEGKSLEQVLQRRRDRGEGPLPLAAVAHIAYQLAQALTHAHQQKVLHNDIKPANILLEKPPEGANGKTHGRIKLMDFGISWMADRPLASGASRLSGTRPFVAPERFRKQPPSPASDVYQLGTTLFALATGTLPYGSLTPEEFQERMLSSDPHPNRVHHVRADVSPRLEALIEGCREKQAAKRWPLPRLLDEVTQIYATKSFTVRDVPRSGIAQELLDRIQTDLALKNYYRAAEAIELVREFVAGGGKDIDQALLARYEAALAKYEPHRAAVELARRVEREHILPVDKMMRRLYDRYGRGRPLLTDEEKGILKESESGDDVTVVRRSLIDEIMRHTSAAIRELSQIEPEQVGEVHRRLVDRASSQEEACTDLVSRMVKFGEDYHRTPAS